ncbi:putative rRNA maturation factor [Lachnospiraceae bacterium PF1-21]|uniref:Endoribonuclease YbeY n=1 Tax=Ohessyouella blattaphilus TaxID=2949333 RepID=A0ABT1EET7_9FIRM|nr:rRNA maturation RNase YbeY [Ohessyouella blattaphilus]MCP1109195.1 rRNA maturation RNase YbeY [Ohessyouella blattaphilus]MCR8562589.1 rRNA maturation RNase YbeY [Ohessyouella blattaphilus]
MTLFYEDESEISLGLDGEETAFAVIEGALDYLSVPFECEVNLLLTNNEQIKSLNKEFREIDKATDVLSFPMNDFAVPLDFTAEEHLSFNPESGELLLGDIVISKEKVLSQAAEYGHESMREYAFLIIHSVLHLLGYDHLEEGERKVMEEKQKEILDFLEIRR